MYLIKNDLVSEERKCFDIEEEKQMEEEKKLQNAKQKKQQEKKRKNRLQNLQNLKPGRNLWQKCIPELLMQTLWKRFLLIN